MQLLITALLVLLFCTTTAQAGFIIVPLVFGAAFAATVTGAIVSGIITLAVSFGLSYVATKLMTKKPEPMMSPTGDSVGGTQLDLRVDADIPQSLLLGYASTAGSSAYFATYGTNNNNLIEIVALGDHPCAGLQAAFIDGLPVTFRDSGTNRGMVVDGYTGVIGTLTPAQVGAQFGSFDGLLGLSIDDVAYALMQEQGLLQTYGDLLAVKFYDGKQTAADAFAVSALGTRENQPWTNEHIGVGNTYIRLHSIYDQEKVPGRMRWRFVVKGAFLYDPRKDSSVGGSGTHRFDDVSTHEWSENVAVQVYNIVRGIYVENALGDREFFYGLENTSADQLPLSIWFAAMNECDIPTVSLNEDGEEVTEPQFVAGGEISVDTEPLEAIKGLLKACGGRFVEIGGIYKLYIGAPGMPVLAIDDGSVLASREDRFKPILPLEERVNYLTAKYTASSDGWISKVAPPRENTDWREEDGRRLPADLTAPMVQSGGQIQRLQEQLLNRSRRQRKHVLPLPPRAMVLEPGDVFMWDSVRNSYDGKLFEVDSADYEPNLITNVSVTEVDPADYDWVANQTIPIKPGRIITTRPPAKVVDGFNATPFIFSGDNELKLPAIRLTWGDPQDGDVTAILWQIRRPSAITDFSSGRYEAVGDEQLAITAGLQSITDYEIRAKFESFNGFGTEWSLWIPVTTLDVRLAPADIGPALHDYIFAQQTANRTSIKKVLDAVASIAAEVDAVSDLNKKTLRRELRSGDSSVTASFEEAITVATGPGSAIAEAITLLEAEVDGFEASLKATFIVGVTPAGALAAYELQTNAEEASAGFRVVAFDDGHGGATGQIFMDADKFYVGKSEEDIDFFPIFTIDTGTATIVLNGDLIAEGSITADKINVSTLSAISANFGDTTYTGKAKSFNDDFVIDFANSQIIVYGA